VDAEFETVRRADGRKVKQLKTQVANVPRMKVNADGKTYRAVVVRDVRTEHRAVLFAVGQPAHRLSATALLREASCGASSGSKKISRRADAKARTPAEGVRRRHCPGVAP
jgi:hypothetical protein